jgi:hypothetical protein
MNEKIIHFNRQQSCWGVGPKLYNCNGYHSCDYCGEWSSRRDARCEARAGGYFCTRKRGHDGPHVACYIASSDKDQHWVLVWDDNNRIYYGKPMPGRKMVEERW